ncbi:MAG TPA: tRNA lysidine(34) synthetase TilS, partial [Rectinemataceae bacterium]
MRAHESESIAISGIRSFFALHPEIQVAESALALSGGRDSSLLARLLVDLGMAPALSIYVNHRLRSNSELEAEICIIEKICGNLGIPLSILDIGPGSIERLARFQGIGIEAAARRLRYQALVEETKKKGLKAILTGHHQDDQLETLFLRLMRSSGSKGLGCMRAVRQIGPGIKLARPLLGVASRD